MIRSTTRPPARRAKSGASASHIVLTAFIPPASRASTSRWTMSIVPRGDWRIRTSMSFAPPPNFTSTGSLAFAAARSSSLRSRIRRRAATGSATSRIWTCPIITGAVDCAWNPPAARATFAAFDAAATTLGSSIAIGMR